MRAGTWKWLTAAGILAAAVTVVGLAYLPPPAASPAAEAARPDRRDFALTDFNGQAVTLTSYRGKWLLMFFGYTGCPDVCPTTLSNLAQTLAGMGDAAQKIQALFVTVDPDRDTAPVLKDYLANFGGGMIGLTGTAAQISAAAKAYQVFYRKHPNADGGYLMEHSTAFALISPSGIYVRAFRPDDAPEDFAREVLTAMQDAKE